VIVLKFTAIRRIEMVFYYGISTAFIVQLLHILVKYEGWSRK